MKTITCYGDIYKFKTLWSWRQLKFIKTDQFFLIRTGVKVTLSLIREKVIFASLGGLNFSYDSGVGFFVNDRRDRFLKVYFETGSRLRLV